MNRIGKYGLRALLALTLLAMSFPGTAMAAGTAAGTLISNTASVDFQVGGVPQATVTSVAATFNVDRKVDLTVTAGAGAPAFANQTSAPMVFTVTNTGNDAFYYQLSAAENTDTNAILSLTTDIWLDADASGTVTAGDTLYVNETTFGTFSANESFQIVVTGDISSGALDTQSASVDFTAKTFTALGVEAVSGGGAGTGAAIVLADLSATAGPTDYDGDGTATNTYTVQGATLSISKSQTLISDGAGGTAGFIPGATVEYSIAIEQTGGASTPTAVTMTDTLDVANLTFLTGQYSGGTDVQIDAYDATTTGTSTTYTSGVFSSPDVTVTCPAGALNEVGDICTIKLRVQIK